MDIVKINNNKNMEYQYNKITGKVYEGKNQAELLSKKKKIIKRMDNFFNNPQLRVRIKKGKGRTSIFGD